MTHRHPGFPVIRATCTALALCFAAPLAAQPPEIEQVLARMHSAEFTTLRCDIALRTETLSPSGEAVRPGQAVATVISALLARPNRFHIAVTAPREDGDGLCVSDGRRALYVSRLLGQAASAEAPVGLDGIDLTTLTMTGAGSSLLLQSALGIRSPVLDILGDPSRADAQLGEPQVVGGALCDVIDLSTEHGGQVMTLRLFADQESGLLRRRELTMGMASHGPAMRVEEEFIALEVDGPVSESDFALEVPPGVSVGDSLDPGTVMRRFDVEGP